MIQIHHELTVESGDPMEEAITLWLVSYQQHSDATRTHAFIEALARWCLAQGWLLETGEDPYLSKDLSVFAGFSRPDEGWEQTT